MKNFFKPLSDDICFNYIFSKREFAVDLINAFFYKDYDLENLDLQDERILQQEKHKDIVLEFEDTIYNIESYSTFGTYNIQKSKLFSFKVYGSQIDCNEYITPKKVIQLNICEKVNINTVIDKYEFINHRTNDADILKDDFNIYVVNLDKVKDKEYNVGVNDKAVKYLKLFNAKSIDEMNEISKGDEKLMVMSESLARFLNDEETQRLFDREKWKAKENQEIGEERSLNTVAVNMLRANEPVEKIESFTGLSNTTILNLKKSMSA